MEIFSRGFHHMTCISLSTDSILCLSRLLRAAPCSCLWLCCSAGNSFHSLHCLSAVGLVGLSLHRVHLATVAGVGLVGLSLHRICLATVGHEDTTSPVAGHSFPSTAAICHNNNNIYIYVGISQADWAGLDKALMGENLE